MSKHSVLVLSTMAYWMDRAATAVAATPPRPWLPPKMSRQNARSVLVESKENCVVAGVCDKSDDREREVWRYLRPLEIPTRPLTNTASKSRPTAVDRAPANFLQEIAISYLQL